MATNKVTPIQLLRSEVDNKRPDPTKLLIGQPAVNINEDQPGLFFRSEPSQDLIKIGPCYVGEDSPNDPLIAPIGWPGNSVGELWLDKRTATPITAPNLRAGVSYQIVTLGTTNFVSIGAASNTVGVIFTATGPGLGDGTAKYTGLTQPFPVLRVWDGVSWVSCMPYTYANTVVSDTAPSTTDHPPGTLWWSSGTGLMYVLYSDGTNPPTWTQISSTPVG
jgi:hypothetical protein